MLVILLEFSAMLKLVINADDFGFSETVNEAILKSFRFGILPSTSIMANGKLFDHAVEIIRSNPKLDIGVHLTLVEEKPILNQNKIPSLVVENGNFYKHAIDFTKKYLSEKISIEEVRNELKAQIEKLLDHGIKISHIDSHQHLHILPRILDITIELANRYKIKFIRIPKEKFSAYMFANFKSVYRIAQMAALNYFCSKAKEKISFKTDHFAGFYFGGKLSKQNLITLINHLPANGNCELMCHPGLEDVSNLNNFSQYRKVEEAEVLIHQEVVQILKMKNIEITSFQKLIH